MNLAELAEQAVARKGEYVNLIFDDEEYKNVQMLEKSARFFSLMGFSRFRQPEGVHRVRIKVDKAPPRGYNS